MQYLPKLQSNMSFSITKDVLRWSKKYSKNLPLKLTSIFGVSLDFGADTISFDKNRTFETDLLTFRLPMVHGTKHFVHVCVCSLYTLYTQSWT